MGKKGKGHGKRSGGTKLASERTVYRDASLAWEAFQRIGGLDLADRDSDLEKELLIRLNQPHVATLDEALWHATTDELVRALFAAISPFVDMFRDTLNFFKAASANEGRQQWEIKIDEEHLDQKAFERFLSTVSEVKAKLDVPDFDAGVAFGLIHRLPESSESKGLFAESSTGDPEADQWIADYRQGAFPNLPARMHSMKLTPGLEDFRRVLTARLSILGAAFGDRETLKDKVEWKFQNPDAYHPMTVGQQDHDYWCGSAFTRLHHAAHLSSDEIAQADAELQATFAGPRRYLDHLASSEQLERILSLPVWGNRHELYAVWVATVIVGALPDHEVELHQEDGRIVFAFKETEVARVMTSYPERRLIAERRTPLANPIGEGRVGAVQPDFGIWVEAQGSDACQLVVEVKHYKREKARAFKAVLADYARAHPDAQVALVNHGPLSYLVDEISERKLADRCRTIGNLTSRNMEARASLEKLVRVAVGTPVRRRQSSGSASFLIDISGSMDRLLRADVLQQAADHASRAGAFEAALVNVEIVERLDLKEIPTLDVARHGGGGTRLEPSASELLQSTGLLVALTDDEGFEQLEQAGFRVDVLERFGPAILAEVRLTG